MNDAQSPAVELKGFRDGLHLIINLAVQSEDIESAIKRRMANLGDSLAGTSIRLDLRNGAISDDKLDSVKRLMYDAYGLEVRENPAEISDRSPQHSQSLFGAETDPAELRAAPAIYQYRQQTPEENLPSEESDKAQIVRRTLRSGQVERFLEGSIIVLGDVNPGAEVVAAGDVVVLGNLRGVAHAGALGETSSLIIATHLAPTQLRIGRLVTRPPSQKRRRNQKMEMARVKGHGIIVEEFEALSQKQAQRKR